MSHNSTSIILLIYYESKYSLPFTQIFSTEIKWERPLNNYITMVDIWSALGLSETAIFDLHHGSTEPFPQDAEGDSTLEGRLPSWGCHLSVPLIAMSLFSLFYCNRDYKNVPQTLFFIKSQDALNDIDKKNITFPAKKDKSSAPSMWRSSVDWSFWGNQNTEVKRNMFFVLFF